MESLLQEILYEVKQLNNSYDFVFSIINLICTIILIYPVYSLIKEKIEQSKPKVIVNFEIVRTSLACIVIRNVSKNPAELISMTFNEEFLEELSEDLKNKLKGLENTKIYIGQNQKWVINFETNIFDIIQKFNNTKCIINYKYVKAGDKKIINEKVEIDFKNYSFFTLYKSELDEINQTIKKTNDILNEIKKSDIQRKYTPVTKSEDYTKTTDLKDGWEKIIKQ